MYIYIIVHVFYSFQWLAWCCWCGCSASLGRTGRLGAATLGAAVSACERGGAPSWSCMRSGENQKVSTTSHITCPSLRQSIYITNCYISYLYHNIYMFIYSINLICVICSNLSIGIPISHLMLWLQGAYWTGAIHLLQEAWRKGPGCSECGAVPALDRASSQGP